VAHAFILEAAYQQLGGVRDYSDWGSELAVAGPIQMV
jgi:hypothetical protein